MEAPKGMKKSRVVKEDLSRFGVTYQFNKFPTDYYLDQIESWHAFQEEKNILKSKYPDIDDMTREQRREWYSECLDLMIVSKNLQLAFEELAERFQIYVHLPHYESIRDDRYDAIYRGKQGRKKREK
jgi:hypothetical protein